ncbi:ribonuclease D [Asticcacaulis excentricus]|uniref:Ribonuclease D n=1 Tax=Asticcacaulis excentricus (strain ATCC 15261 / DSM 4724 / KCTC 12464 / NCIMB 9791 / VKM B-1370 / CB 48) TaxID=573065 RepID=E8RT37_ASTEC|nr:ribonuclease D [Asticcacaulis excentricus]ADU14658.1 ribonuclease D [Asticcacaulis excentricus CB 48]
MPTITTTAALTDFCAKIASAPFITVDTEFMRETTYWPKLCLIQAASEEHAGIIDPLSPDLDLKPFLDLLTDPAILKVFHACRQDVEIFNNLGAMPAPVFDTQVAAMAAGFGDQVAYDSLVRQVIKVDIDKGSRFTDWSRRPLSEQQLQYALGDVTHLARLYPKLVEKLKAQNRYEWVAAEMADLTDPKLYNTSPDDAWRRLRPRKPSLKYMAVFKEVAAWRERVAQERDQPRGRILKDEGVDEIATQLPTDAAAFDRLRSTPKGFGASKFGIELCDVIQTALAEPEKYAPKVDKAPPPVQVPASVVELLKVLLRVRCEDEGVAPKLIASVADLEKIALDDKANVPALEGWRRKVFGDDAIKLKKGELALVLNGTRVEVVELD